MNTACLGILLLFAPLTWAAADVTVGDSSESVRSNLGVPRGTLRVGDRDILYYDRGEVELGSGVVTRVSLRSEDEQAALEAKRAAEARRVREEREILRARLIAEGRELKARKLADLSFQSAPLDYQVAFWEDFSRRYADVPSGEQLQVARARLTEQATERQAKSEQIRRLAELEARVAEAEARSEAMADRPVRRFYYPYHPPHGPSYPINFAPVEYRWFESPLPYATSPGMPPLEPVYRKDSAPWPGNPTTDGAPIWDRPGERHRTDRNTPGMRDNSSSRGRD